MKRIGVVLVAGLAAVAAAGAQTGAISLQVRPTQLGPTQNALLSGRVSSGRTGETVTIQLKLCTQQSFRNVAVLKTAPGGVWRLEYSVGMNATMRARWQGVASRAVLVRQAPLVQLDQKTAREFEVGVGSLGLMWRKRVQIQQRAGGRWRLLRSVTLTDTHAGPGSSGVWTNASFRLSVPVGTPLRAVLTPAQARPCYLGGASNVVRVRG